MSCYEEVQEPDREQVGRIFIKVDIGADGQGRAFEVAADTLGEPAVRSCVEQVMNRHLLDDVNGEARFQVQFDISFIHSPKEPSDVDPEGESPGCELDELPRAYEQVEPGIGRCARSMLEGPDGEPGAVLISWKFGQDGRVRDMVKTSTLENIEVLECLEAALNEMVISPYQSGFCCALLTLVFDREVGVYFSIVLR